MNGVSKVFPRNSYKSVIVKEEGGYEWKEKKQVLGTDSKVK